MNRSVAIAGVAIGLVGIWLLTKKAQAGEGGSCRDLTAGVRYEAYYRGSRKTVKAALGACYDSIFYLEVWSDYYMDWEQPTDPAHDYLEPGAKCSIQVQAPCRLCGFEWL